MSSEKPAVNIPERWVGKEDSVAVKGTFHIKSSATDGPIAGSSSNENQMGSEVGKMDSLFRADQNEIIRRRLLIDGDGQGDDKKLTKLTQVYVMLGEDGVSAEDLLKNYKSLLSTSNALVSTVWKTVHSIEVNEKAKVYWMEIMNRIGEELNHHRTLVAAQREKLAELKLVKQRHVEAANAVQLLEGTTERETLEQQCEELGTQLEELKKRDAELAELIAYRKLHLNQLCSLAKRLSDDGPDVSEAVKEMEEKVLSDVSLDLD